MGVALGRGVTVTVGVRVAVAVGAGEGVAVGVLCAIGTFNSGVWVSCGAGAAVQAARRAARIARMRPGFLMFISVGWGNPKINHTAKSGVVIKLIPLPPTPPPEGGGEKTGINEEGRKCQRRG
jgi:hypothetical protein